MIFVLITLGLTKAKCRRMRRPREDRITNYIAILYDRTVTLRHLWLTKAGWINQNIQLNTIKIHFLTFIWISYTRKAVFYLRLKFSFRFLFTGFSMVFSCQHPCFSLHQIFHPYNYDEHFQVHDATHVKKINGQKVVLHYIISEKWRKRDKSKHYCIMYFMGWAGARKYFLRHLEHQQKEQP